MSEYLKGILKPARCNWPRQRYVLYIFVLSAISTTSFAYYEAHPAIRMSEVLTSQQAQSVYHRVEDIELVDKFYKFRVDSEYCNQDVSSMSQFRIRLQEITTLAQAISQFRKGDSKLSKELSEQFSIRADSVMDIISQPVKSAANLAGQVVEDLDETVNGVPVAPTETFNYPVSESKDPVVAMHKRNIASQFGLDLYSTNPKVQEFLNAVASARSSGRISAGTPTLRSQINRPLRAADMEVEADIAFLLKNKNADELYQINKDLLSAMNINAGIIDRFLRHGVFSPTRITRISRYLDSMSGVRNRSAFIEAASHAENEVMALAFDETAMMLKYYDGKIASLEKLYAGSEVLEAISKDGRIVYFVPVDLIYWTKQTEHLFDSLKRRAESSGFSSWELVTAGSVTEEADKELRQREFTVRDKFVNK